MLFAKKNLTDKPTCKHIQGLPWWLSSNESACSARDVAGTGRFNPWVGKIPLEKGMATHSNILAWRIPWTEELEGYSPRGRKELDMTEQLTLSLGLS